MRQGVVPAALQIGSVPGAAVLHEIRVRAPITRDRLAEVTRLSPATVNRQVTSLTALGLVTERRDLISGGRVGRPRVPLALDSDASCVAGMHIGARRTLLTVADLAGRSLYSHAVLTPSGDPAAAVTSLCDQMADLALRFSGRRLLWAGVATGGRVGVADGRVDHPLLGWRGVDVGQRLSAALGVPASVCEHVQAMAAADLLLTHPRTYDRCGLFFYARETTGMAVTVDGRVLVPTHGSGSIGHLRVDSSVLADGPSVLADVVGSAPAAAAALRLGVPPDAEPIADERARILGEVVAVFRDALNPDSVVVAGDAFGAHPDGLAPVQAAFDAASALERPLELAPSGFGISVQESAAIAAALSVIYSDPLAALTG